MIVSDDDGPVISATRPRCSIVLSSKLTDTNNDATPELTSHRTATGKSSPSRSGTGTGTKCVANDAALNVDDDEGILKKGTAPKGTLFAYVLFIDSHLFVP